MQKRRIVLLRKFGKLLVKLVIVLLPVLVGPGSGNIHISNSNVVIYHGQQEEIAPSAVRQPEYEISTQGGQNAEMRRCAHRECERVDVLPDGSVIHVSGFVRGESIGGNNIWFQVEHNSRTGYVFGKLVRDINRIG